MSNFLEDKEWKIEDDLDDSWSGIYNYILIHKPCNMLHFFYINGPKVSHRERCGYCNAQIPSEWLNKILYLVNLERLFR